MTVLTTAFVGYLYCTLNICTVRPRNQVYGLRFVVFCRGLMMLEFTFKVISLTQGPQCLSWWRHQMETFSALLALCVGNSPDTVEFPTQRPVTRFDVSFDLRLNKRLSKQSWGWRFETPSRPLWRHWNKNWHWYINSITVEHKKTAYMNNAVYWRLDCVQCHIISNVKFGHMEVKFY